MIMYAGEQQAGTKFDFCSSGPAFSGSSNTHRASCFAEERP